MKTREHELIDFIKDLTGDRRIGDDCAVLPGQTLATKDMLVEGVHFRLSTTSMAELGFKAMAVNLSDIAAMAGRPRQALVGLSFPGKLSGKPIEELFAGIESCARAYRTSIAGGDLCAGEKLVISITVLGDAHERGFLLRSGASPGDVVIATGDFGASRAGLWLLESGAVAPSSCIERHRRPLPRLCESWAVVRTTAGQGALMDTSDGLADALIQIAGQSQVSIEVNAANVPISSDTKLVAAMMERDVLELALFGGEDYELVAAISQEHWAQLKADQHNPFTEIGRVKSGAGVFLVKDNGKEELDLSRTFDHFRPC